MPVLAQGAAPAATTAVPPAGPASPTPSSECKSTRVEGLRTLLTTAEGAVRKTPALALESLKQAEAMLNCLDSVPPPELLKDLFRYKGVALFLQKNRTAAEDAFYQAAVIDSALNCEDQVSGFGNPALTRELTSLCEKATLEAQDTEIRVRVVNLKGAEAVFVDSVDKTTREDFISLRLIAGYHLVQAKSAGAIKSGWVQINIPEGEEARFQEIDLRKLKLVTFVEQQIPVGTLRIEGLETGSEVMVDGRTRRDLPVLRNVEAGERHLLIRSPDGSVMGVTVTVVANEETVYKSSALAMETGGGFDLRKGLSFGALGLSGLALVGSGVSFGLAAQEFSKAEASYQTYSSTTGVDGAYESLWAETEDHLAAGRTFRLTGAAAGGVGLAAAGVGAFLLFTGGGEPEVAGFFKPFVVPLVAGDRPGSGVAVGVQGRF